MDFLGLFDGFSLLVVSGIFLWFSRVFQGFLMGFLGFSNVFFFFLMEFPTICFIGFHLCLMIFLGSCLFVVVVFQEKSFLSSLVVFFFFLIMCYYSYLFLSFLWALKGFVVYSFGLLCFVR